MDSMTLNADDFMDDYEQELNSYLTVVFNPKAPKRRKRKQEELLFELDGYEEEE